MSPTNTVRTDADAKKRGVSRLVVPAVVVALFLALVVFGIQLFSGAGAPPTVTAPTSSSPASPSAVPTPEATTTTPAAELPPASAPRQVTIESADFTVPVLPLTPTEADLAAQSLVPPETLDGYWLTNFGTPGEGSKDTVYITGHSWEGRDSPFNRLSSDVEVGDTVTLTTAEGEIAYVVDSITTHNKDTLKDSDIWDIVPNRLVLISCYTEDLWGKNVIVTATPVI